MRPETAQKLERMYQNLLKFDETNLTRLEQDLRSNGEANESPLIKGLFI